MSFSLMEFIELLGEPEPKRTRKAQRTKFRKYAAYQRIRCVNCDNTTSQPLLTRKPCACGSVCWYEGQKPRPIWRAVTVPAFLAVSTEDFEASQS